MMESLLTLTNLSAQEFLILTLIVLVAGIVRGFSGFALSALIMATAVLILPPVELLPMLWWLELSASVLMIKESWAAADRGTAIGLVIGSTAGWPLGLWLTVTLPVETSKLIALSIIIVLAISQLGKLKLSFLATRPGLYGTGIVAGIVSGLAHVGGMVVALYVLASDAPARQMRASLVLFLFLGSLTSMITLLIFGVMDFSGVTRGLIFAVPTMIGVYLGQKLFIPTLSQYYRAFCLTLLCLLAVASLIRTQVT
ncbi:sulfite exporter TauE/SafE family protein [Cognatiyoonia sp. IB215446]|uniref:sulfite exporter TauE/SafE family protein n=1 Tax=Cognatiyoonia sp. IB215446 TaxID=3097355 RepID=UPI002A13D371|nr:sulfite exporter TauE/SafE family protein [Cognatiyoonia sp. IB215446]MDX8347456.1 sulfite exporter TauE/SafE family protein [Cognatiyoonia sp. IB215446]